MSNPSNTRSTDHSDCPDWHQFFIEAKRPDQAWEWMCQSRSGPESQDWVRPEVAEAWFRCIDQYQLPVGHDHCQTTDAASVPLIRVGRKALPTGIQELSLDIAESLAETQISYVVAGADGRLLDVHDRGLGSCPLGRHLLHANVDWREDVLGNNGVGSALTVRKAIAFEGKEHYSRRLHALVTAGLPIFDEQGEVLVVLGLVSDQRGSAEALLSLLRLAEKKYKGERPARDLLLPTARPVEIRPSVIATADNTLICDTVVQNQLDKAVRLQQCGIPLLITGESGSGKEYLVRFAHRLGPRRDGPLLAVNCASIPKELIESELFGYEAGSFTGAHNRGKPGKFRLADKGVLFLDEIGDMSFDLQATLLRVLESGEFVPVGGVKPVKVDVQIVAATNVDLQEAIRKGTFRRDLYYRLNGARLHLTPLRERTDRLHIIQAMFRQELAQLESPVQALSADVLRFFEQHPWPGNLRELRHVLRNALSVATGSVLKLDDLPDDFVAEFSIPLEALSEQISVPLADPFESLAETESRRIEAVLQQCQGNMSRAARLLGIARSTLYQKMSRYGVDMRPGARRIRG